MSFCDEFNNGIKKALLSIVAKYFDSDIFAFDSWIDACTNAIVGTGSDLLDIVANDIASHRKGHNTVSNLTDLKLTYRAFKRNPKMWFIYSSADSLGKPLFWNDLDQINNACNIHSSAGLLDLLSNEPQSRKDLHVLLTEGSNMLPIFMLNTYIKRYFDIKPHDLRSQLNKQGKMNLIQTHVAQRIINVNHYQEASKLLAQIKYEIDYDDKYDANLDILAYQLMTKPNKTSIAK